MYRQLNLIIVKMQKMRLMSDYGVSPEFIQVVCFTTFSHKLQFKDCDNSRRYEL